MSLDCMMSGKIKLDLDLTIDSLMSLSWVKIVTFIPDVWGGGRSSSLYKRWAYEATRSALESAQGG